MYRFIFMPEIFVPEEPTPKEQGSVLLSRNFYLAHVR